MKIQNVSSIVVDIPDGSLLPGESKTVADSPSLQSLVSAGLLVEVVAEPKVEETDPAPKSRKKKEAE